MDQSGRRHLLIGGEESAPVEPSGGTLAIDFRPLVFGRARRVYLDVCCTDPALNSEFQEIAVDVLETVVAAAEPVVEAMKVIDRWRRLLRAGATGLRENERIGLFAELSMLVALNESGADVPATCWTGPLRSAHDFELADRCIEVKGFGKSSSVIRVHGLEQLARHDNRPLHLALATVDLDPAGETIPDLARKLTVLFEDDTELTERLHRARVDLADPVIRSSAYSLKSLFIVDVDDDTPCLVESSFADGSAPAGVSRVAYDLDLGDLLGHARSANIADAQHWWGDD